MARKRGYKITHVPRGTYQKIADELGLSRGHVKNIANGLARNARVEIMLEEAARDYYRIYQLKMKLKQRREKREAQIKAK